MSGHWDNLKVTGGLQKWKASIEADYKGVTYEKDNYGDTIAKVKNITVGSYNKKKFVGIKHNRPAAGIKEAVQWDKKWDGTLDYKGNKVYKYSNDQYELTLTGYDGVVGKSFPKGSKKTSWMITDKKTGKAQNVTHSTLAKAKKAVMSESIQSFSDFNEQVAADQQNDLYKFVSSQFKKIGIEMRPTAHFSKDRLNNSRNENEITYAEMVSLFKNLIKKYGKKLKNLDDGENFVVKKKQPSSTLWVAFVHNERSDGTKVIDIKTVFSGKQLKIGPGEEVFAV